MTDINEVERASIETGDKTYADRVKQYEYIMRRLSETPKPTYRKLAEELGVHHQHIGRIVKRGVVRPSGRPRSNEGRVKAIVERLDRWQARRTAKLAKGRDVTFEEGHIAKLEAKLADLT